jgi:hypothetical protein
MGRYAGVLGVHRFKIKEHVRALDWGSARTSNLKVLRAGSRTRGDCAEHENLDADGNAAYQVGPIVFLCDSHLDLDIGTDAARGFVGKRRDNRLGCASKSPRGAWIHPCVQKRRFPPVSTTDMHIGCPVRSASAFAA